ncbi:hypothetical protein CERZMDRAFT_95418 [Cercospora zeae-maydis SCOH1-5]|uniref:Major facilitator superfamily (MFS) profile domain-containing protein n=1 Tax=Cercospora zeae-maydis SCOH1-5 TaxID=717836 RepID=A0A6A6FNK3_9PEZI|nr:hypothetical protein CERZMDRAFT_95418 [Cercospora zeae-maydis SCOH1-5]
MSTAASNEYHVDNNKDTKSSFFKGSGSPERPTETDFPDPKRLILVMIGLFLALFAAKMDATILATAILYIMTDFNTIRDVSWYAAAIMLVSAAFQSTWGKIFRYFPIGIMFLSRFLSSKAIARLGAPGMTAGVFTLIAFSTPRTPWCQRHASSGA